MDTKGGKLRWGGDGGVLNWVIGIDMYALMCIKLMTNKKKRYRRCQSVEKGTDHTRILYHDGVFAFYTTEEKAL